MSEILLEQPGTFNTGDADTLQIGGVAINALPGVTLNQEDLPTDVRDLMLAAEGDDEKPPFNSSL